MAKHKIRNVEEFIEKQEDHVADICQMIDDLFMSYPNVRSKIRFDIPFYDYGTWICYLNPLKNKEAIELVFLQGKKLQPIFPFLKDKGRKMVAGMEIDQINDQVLEEIAMVWEESLALSISEKSK